MGVWRILLPKCHGLGLSDIDLQASFVSPFGNLI